uniref:RAS protein activator like-3-like n=1 Tax=Lonchura striata TaxID=40157 RepID=UPI000B4C5361|nr:RAS protein activator like-3-like [Lonchura striata domestica]
MASCPRGTPLETSPPPLAPVPPDATVWDASRFSLVDGHLVALGRDEEDSCERLELALTLWVYEGRDLPARCRLRCQLQLDGAVFARTTAKAAGADGHLFWGELFQLPALPPARALTVALCRDDRAGGRPLAAVTIPLAELAAAPQPLERWYALSGAGGRRAPAVRLRGRYRRVRVLPIVRYKEMAEFITFHYRELCGRLEPAIAARHKEELAGALVRVLQSTGKAKSFLIDLGVAELDRFDEHEALIFRENTLATKAIDEFMKLVGAKYLQDTLGEVVAQLCSSEESSEVDPSKCSGLELSEHQQHLRQVCEETLRRITDGSESFPAELGEVFAAWSDECAARGKAAIGRRLVSSSLFLRFLCPAIMSPSLFGLVQEYPGEATARSLTLVAKVIQNLANFTTFGEKEPYMTFMNDFLERHWATMTDFLQAVATAEASAHMATYDGRVDLALELATLHLLLCDIFSSLDQATQEELEPLPTILRAIREGTPVPVSVRLSSTARRRYLGTPGATWGGTNRGLVALTGCHFHVSRCRYRVSRCRYRVSRCDCRAVTGPLPGHYRAVTGPLPVSLSQPRGKLRSSASLPRKSTVPWQRLAEDSVAPGELYALRPLEKHRRLLEEVTGGGWHLPVPPGKLVPDVPSPR